MALRESLLWKTLKKALPEILFYRIESGITPGFPDVIGIDKQTAEVYFIELKAWKSIGHTPQFGNVKTSQRNVHADLRKVGANNYVLGINSVGKYYIGQFDGMNSINWVYVEKLGDLLQFLRKETNDG